VKKRSLGENEKNKEKIWARKKIWALKNPVVVAG